MPVVFHSDIRYKKACKPAFFYKRHSNKGANVIYSKKRCDILMFKEIITYLRYCKPLRIFKHYLPDPSIYLIGYNTPCIIIKYMCLFIVIAYIQSTVEAEMIHKCVQCIFYHRIYIIIRDIYKLLPRRYKFHLPPACRIVTHESFMLNK